jgi:hypothetical protein
MVYTGSPPESSSSHGSVSASVETEEGASDSRELLPVSPRPPFSHENREAATTVVTIINESVLQKIFFI